MGLLFDLLIETIKTSKGVYTADQHDLHRIEKAQTLLSQISVQEFADLHREYWALSLDRFYQLPNEVHEWFIERRDGYFDRFPRLFDTYPHGLVRRKMVESIYRKYDGLTYDIIPFFNHISSQEALMPILIDVSLQTGDFRPLRRIVWFSNAGSLAETFIRERMKLLPLNDPLRKELEDTLH